MTRPKTPQHRRQNSPHYATPAFTTPLPWTSRTSRATTWSAHITCRRPRIATTCTSQDKLKAATPPTPTPTERCPLPASSNIALAASASLLAASVALPCALAYHDAAHAHEPFAMHLAAYQSHFHVILGSLVFATLHSGLASIRPFATPYIGERLYRVIFALVSLPSATALIAFFLKHRYDGTLFFAHSLQSYPLTHSLVYVTTFVSFLFLYPATFNLLEVAAVQKPGLRIYEKGITRITRHPQLFGQLLWCLSHTAWIGSSFSVVASLSLVAHHLFGAWNGDRRLRDKFGEEWLRYAERTSIVPFGAMLSGAQSFQLREFLTPAYVGVVLATLGFYAAHPLMMEAAMKLKF